MRTYFIIFNSFSCIQCINTDFGLQLHDSLSETIYHGFIYCLKMLRRKCYSWTKHTNTTLWLFVKHMDSVTSKIPKKLWNCKKTCSATTNLVFRCGEATRDEQTCPFTTAVTLQPERERERDKKGRWKRCILSHSHMSCNHLLFHWQRLLLAKFMWPLPQPLTSTEKHLFEGKDNWHNPAQILLMWFTLNH